MTKIRNLNKAKAADFLTTEEAARELGIKPTAIRNYLYERKLTTFKFKNATLLSRREVQGWKKRQRQR
jgi:excisionase family DNA binding protein